MTPLEIAQKAGKKASQQLRVEYPKTTSTKATLPGNSKSKITG